MTISSGDNQPTGKSDPLGDDLFGELFGGHSSGSQTPPGPVTPPTPEPAKVVTEAETGVASHLQPESSERSKSSQRSDPGQAPARTTDPPPAKATSRPADLTAGLPGFRSVPTPTVPTSLEEAGLSSSLICDMILKQVFLESNILGKTIAQRLRLPFFLIEEPLRFLKAERCLSVGKGAEYGAATYEFILTDLGRDRARSAFDQCRYVGPAPVPIKQYSRQCVAQQVSDIPCTPKVLSSAFSQLIIRPFLLEELGPAVCSGNSIFLYGPPGNGKTQIAKGLGRFLNENGGEIWIPYAIQSEGSIITVFDPTLHTTTDGDGRLETDQPGSDPRWRKIKRPVVITGGELTLDMLDLRYNSGSNFYTAPIHVKANGGVFLIDDFGRQIVSPKDLLNRWIFPLEEGIDYLSLATGKKFPIPFEQLIIFSTNLDPGDLVDEAFLRRIKHKIQIGPPSRDLYTEIFKLCCGQRQIPFKRQAVDFLYQHFYDQGKQPRSSDPRDLLEMAGSICRFRDERVELTPELMAEATRRFFCSLTSPG